MKQEFENGQVKIAKLLKSLPHPGRILLDSIDNGITGFYLRPKEIPQVITGKISELPWGSVELKITNGEKNFVDGYPIQLSLHSQEWEKWCRGNQPFIIQEKDVGKKIDVIREREKNFNRNLLHEFLDRLSITITIKEDDKERILDPENYPHFFWDDSISVSGTSHMMDRLSIGAVVNGISQDSGLTIKGSELYLKYGKFLTKERWPLMNAVIKWHKTLIALLHMMKRAAVNIPIDFEKMTQICWDEISAVSKRH